VWERVFAFRARAAIQVGIVAPQRVLSSAQQQVMNRAEQDVRLRLPFARASR
jgi:hypothetical protein